MATLTTLEKATGWDFDKWVDDYLKGELGMSTATDRGEIQKILKRNKLTTLYGLALSGQVPLTQ